tara:strand:- start:3077 stop:4426 length:1350 start_codon:yes stop_codon:yes gene_type:complete
MKLTENELKKSGQNLRGLLNDLKRRPQDAANELGVSIEEIEEYISGIKPISSEFINIACEKWPINERDFFVIRDDCPSGLKIMRSSVSKKSSRVMERAGKPYYEYRDTVITSATSFRPEWIEELCFVKDNDPDNLSVQWNNGHFMHQFTYFIGDVNYYFKDEFGKKCVKEMNTGDSCYITPFVPHSFTTRAGAKKPGLILALTFGSNLTGDAQQELAAISNPVSASEFAMDFSTLEKSTGSLVNYFRNSFSISIQELSERSKVSEKKLQSIESGSSASLDELKKIADAMNINLRDILPNDNKEPGTIIKRYKDGNRWKLGKGKGSYEIVELANTSSLPYTRSLEVSVISDDNYDQLDQNVGLHQYIYNIGNKELVINFEDGYEKLHPGDSCYIKPFFKHNFRGDGKLLCLRIGGRIGGEPHRELSIIGKENSERAISESLPWFNVKGSN